MAIRQQHAMRKHAHQAQRTAERTWSTARECVHAHANMD